MSLIKDMFSTVANCISLLRLVALPFLWVWALQGRFNLVGYGLIFVLLTDVLDGAFARILHQCTELGEKLDSWGDHLVLISSVIWLIFLRGDIFPSNRIITMYPVIAIYLIVILIGLVKHRHFGGEHLLEGKPFALFGYLFLLLAMFGIYSDLAYFLLLGSWLIHSLVNLIHHYRPELFNKHQRSLILGLMGIEIEEGPIRYFFS